MSLETAPLTIANRTFESRLFLGTGKFSSNKAMSDALETSGTQIVTVALRRVDLSGNNDPYANILEHIDPERYLILPNTSGAMNAQEAVRLAIESTNQGTILPINPLVGPAYSPLALTPAVDTW